MSENFLIFCTNSVQNIYQEFLKIRQNTPVSQPNPGFLCGLAPNTQLITISHPKPDGKANLPYPTLHTVFSKIHTSHRSSLTSPQIANVIPDFPLFLLKRISYFVPPNKAIWQKKLKNPTLHAGIWYRPTPEKPQNPNPHNATPQPTRKSSQVWGCETGVC